MNWLTAIGYIAAALAGLFAIVKYVLPKLTKSQDQSDQEIEKKNQDDKNKAKETGRPV